MPKNPPPYKKRFRNSGPPRSNVSVLADITRRIAPPATADDSNFIDALARVLPDGLSAHLKGARIRDGVLVVYAESAAWAARLRLALNEHISSAAAPALPGLPAGARVVARVMPRGGYRR